MTSSSHATWRRFSNDCGRRDSWCTPASVCLRVTASTSWGTTSRPIPLPSKRTSWQQYEGCFHQQTDQACEQPWAYSLMTGSLSISSVPLPSPQSTAREGSCLAVGRRLTKCIRGAERSTVFCTRSTTTLRVQTSNPDNGLELARYESGAETSQLKGSGA